MRTTNLGAVEGLPAADWNEIAGKLAGRSAPAHGSLNSRTTWLTTLNADGSPHVTAVGAMWVDGAYYFQTGATRKGRNVERDGRCALAVSVDGADVVVEGDAVHVTASDEIAAVTQAWADDGWPVEPDPSGSGITAPFNAPTQGPPPWQVFRLVARSVTVVSTTGENGGLTRFDF